jgi:hypothetical protein
MQDPTTAGLNATVQVDVCEARVTCFDVRCRRFVQLSMQTGGGPRGYCLDCIEGRLGVHRDRGARIVYTDAARELLDSSGRKAGWRP